MTKEEIYDEKIGPLMAKIIEACDEHELAMFAHFELDVSADSVTALCTTALTFPATPIAGSMRILKMSKATGVC